MSAGLRVVVSATMVIFIHLGLAYWLWQIPRVEPPTPVTLISMAWVDTPETLPPPEPATIEPIVEPLEPVEEPEPILVQNEVAPPPPPALPKPVAIVQLAYNAFNRQLRLVSADLDGFAHDLHLYFVGRLHQNSTQG